MGNLPEAASGAISFSYLAEIAVGATARVDLCRAADGRLLAVKRLHPHIAEDPGFATQFLDEVWMTASLKHANVVEVAGWGTDDQGSYLAVELVQGVSLSRLMKTVFDTGEQFTERMVVYICSQVSSGLAAAHNLASQEGELLNLVHRDLTPGNVLIGFNGEVKIADFGLAKAKLRLTKTLTGLAKGQPTYMAPEQAKALDIDKRADLFSLGISMFELFSGRRPWLGSTDYEMMQRTANDPPADLFQLRPKIDKELVAIVNRCLEKDPDQRFQSVEEVQARLEGWLRAHGYLEGSLDALARFVRRNAMRQMRWFERAVSGELAPSAPARVGRNLPPRVPSYANVTGLVDPQPTDARRPADPARHRDSRSTRGASPDSRRLPRIVDEQTDVSDAIPRGGPMSPHPPVSQPVIRDLVDRAPASVNDRVPDRLPASVNDRVPDRLPASVNDRVRDRLPASVNIDAESDWGEEVPTLVQKSGSPMIGRRRSQVTPADSGPTPRKLPSIADEESDQRTTAVKGKASVAAQVKQPPLMARSSMRVPNAAEGGAAIADADSEELPTIPANALKASQPPLAPSPIGRPAGRRPSSAPPPRPGSAPPGRIVPKTPNVPTPPVGFAARGGSAYPPSQGALATDAAGRSGQSPGSGGAPNGGAAMARNAVEAVRAAVFAATTEHARISGHSTLDDRSPSPHSRPGDEMSPAPHAMRNPPAADVSRPPEIIGPGGRLISEDSLLAEADRLAIEAVRRAEEAKTAAQRADRKAAQAKLASDAAMIAAEAVRLAQTAGLGAAAQRLADAHQVEQRMISGAEGTSSASHGPVGSQATSIAPSVPPMSMPFSTGRERAPATTPAGRDHVSAGPPMGNSPSSGPPSYLAPQSQPARGSVPPPMGVPPMSASSPRGGYAMDPSAYGANDSGRPSLDPYAFQARLKPSLLRLNAYTLVALAVAAFMLAFVVLWAFFG